MINMHEQITVITLTINQQPIDKTSSVSCSNSLSEIKDTMALGTAHNIFLLRSPSIDIDFIWTYVTNVGESTYVIISIY